MNVSGRCSRWRTERPRSVRSHTEWSTATMVTVPTIPSSCNTRGTRACRRSVQRRRFTGICVHPQHCSSFLVAFFSPTAICTRDTMFTCRWSLLFCVLSVVDDRFSRLLLFLSLAEDEEYTFRYLPHSSRPASSLSLSLAGRHETTTSSTTNKR